MSNLRFIGLDVHAETIAVGVAEPGVEVRSLGVIPNRPESIRRVIKKLGPANQLRVCYEAGPTGYVVDWELTALGVTCEVVAPTLVPVKAGDRVKTDRRDALKLARTYRAGDLRHRFPDTATARLTVCARARQSQSAAAVSRCCQSGAGTTGRGHSGVDTAARPTPTAP
jgi:transposase